MSEYLTKVRNRLQVCFFHLSHEDGFAVIALIYFNTHKHSKSTVFIKKNTQTCTYTSNVNERTLYPFVVCTQIQFSLCQESEKYLYIRNGVDNQRIDNKNMRIAGN